ncbi:translesion DNA synthesis-associated protein ImuA [Massilia sp. TS11]|uniref:translesion DNA synthesis-associated protein ImuA n=1 Tax=Massilia sp. TS11 TaxID=2908003 RepID=UPI001EDBB3B2|nr:translesion DNA synthesis-associated protein ImuA [Massilia sp. TS11]MCG2582935.1 translesion DNA synthesis-associated protein ImuA [Massilia sp. TS11]
MSISSSLATPEAVHPALWLASQLARSQAHCVDTGYPVLSAQLPGGGWPTGCLLDLLLQQHGIGEMRLLRPALRAVAGRRVVLLQPPHAPQALGLAALGLGPEQLAWVRPARSGDALWAAEQILRSGSCGALLFWQTTVRADALRRLHLAAQSGETLFFLLRPLAHAPDASPAPLRLGLHPAAGGLTIDFIKRRGPRREAPLFLPLELPALQRRLPHHAPLDRPLPVAAPARRLQPALVG